MAVTTETSDQLDDYLAVPQVKVPVDQWQGRVRIAYFNYTQGAAAGDANSLQRLVRLPAGKVRVIGSMSKVFSSAFGASRVLDIGHGAYTQPDGTPVAADYDALANNLDVAAAGGDTPDNGTEAGTNGTMLIESRDGFEIVAQVAGGTIPAAATLNGYFAYVVD